MAASPRKSAAKNTVAKPADEMTLQKVIEATKSDVGFVYTAPEFHMPLIVSGDVIINPNMVQDGLIATKCTDKYLESKQEMTQAQETPAVAAKPVFVVESGFDIPVKVRATSTTGGRPGRAAIYPFDTMEIKGSFFVPNKTGKNAKGEDFPSAAKSLQSTVSSANAKYAEVIEGQTRVNKKGKTVPATRQTRLFQVFDTYEFPKGRTPETPDDKGAAGARVFRMPLPE